MIAMLAVKHTLVASSVGRKERISNEGEDKEEEALKVHIYC